jgi:hypothetical protein
MIMANGSVELIGQNVVLDTAGPLVYLGTLDAVTDEGFWLRDADVHNRTDGHANNELYVLEASRDGIRINRRRVLVMRSAVTSLSPLDAAWAE